MTIRAKFTCESVTEFPPDHEGNASYETLFKPVVSGSPENESFYKWTPYGEFKIGVTQRKDFTPGKEYYLDITEAQ